MILHPPIPNFFDRSTAAALAECAQAAYATPEEITAFFGGPESVRILEDARTETRAVAALWGGSLVVAFRGTADLRNWLTDLDVRRVACGDGVEVHEGFHRAYQAICEPLWRAVAELWHGEPVFLTGHSLGGALAMLAHLDLAGGQSARPALSGLYTFGQPRVGNAAFARAYDKSWPGLAWRVVHADDIVPRVPWLMACYRHAGIEEFYAAGGARHENWPWWLKAPSDAAGMYVEWKFGKLALLADHHVGTYQRILAA